MNITVYLGAHEGNDPSYRKAVEELGAWIAGNGNRLVYGGSDEGLMAVIADTVLAHGGEVTGIEAQMFADQGVAHQGLTELVIVPDITERRTRMIELGDVFIAFPGGTGTLEEVSEVVSKICLNQLSQPCIFYNLNGFYDDMKAFLAADDQRGLLHVRTSARHLFRVESDRNRTHHRHTSGLTDGMHARKSKSGDRQNGVQNRHDRQSDDRGNGQ